MNVLSVSFLRLPRAIALFYLCKDSLTLCRPVVRFSHDEARTWSAPRFVTGEPGYWVLNNDRVVRLRSGRLVVPVALHTSGGQWTDRGAVSCWLSDNGGQTWRRARSTLECPELNRYGLQEPGVVELRDGRLRMFLRTNLGVQYFSESRDRGETWGTPQPGNLPSPLSPASIERIPKTGHLLAVWNDISAVPGDRRRLRTPLVAAISKDEGATWTRRRVLRDDPDGWFCYTAIDFTRDAVLLAFVSGGRGLPRLSRTEILRVPLSWLYA